MKNVLFAVIATAMCVGMAHADMMDGQKGYGGQIGIAMPSGDLGDSSNTGFVIGAHYYQALQNNFAVMPALDYFSFGKQSGGADVTNTAISVNGVYNFQNMTNSMELMPFALVGLSYNMMHASTSAGSANDSGIGFNLGIGVNKVLSNGLIAGVS